MPSAVPAMDVLRGAWSEVASVPAGSGPPLPHDETVIHRQDRREAARRRVAPRWELAHRITPYRGTFP